MKNINFFLTWMNIYIIDFLSTVMQNSYISLMSQTSQMSQMSQMSQIHNCYQYKVPFVE